MIIAKKRWDDLTKEDLKEEHLYGKREPHPVETKKNQGAMRSYKGE